MQLFGGNSSSASFIARDVYGTQAVVFEVTSTDGALILTDTITITIRGESTISEPGNPVDSSPTSEADSTYQPMDEEQASRERTVRVLEAMNLVIAKNPASGTVMEGLMATRSSADPSQENENMDANRQARSSSEPQTDREGPVTSLSEGSEFAVEDSTYREEPTPTEEQPPNMWARLWLGMLAFFHNVPATRRRTGE